MKKAAFLKSAMLLTAVTIIAACSGSPDKKKDDSPGQTQAVSQAQPAPAAPAGQPAQPAMANQAGAQPAASVQNQPAPSGQPAPQAVPAPQPGQPAAAPASSQPVQPVQPVQPAAANQAPVQPAASVQTVPQTVIVPQAGQPAAAPASSQPAQPVAANQIPVQPASSAQTAAPAGQAAQASTTVAVGNAPVNQVRITTQGMKFVPDTVNAKVGDQVIFTITQTHLATRVDAATWNANKATPLNGGFNFGVGTYTYVVQPSDVGTIYYVCPPHVGYGMKGRIVVTQ